MKMVNICGHTFVDEFLSANSTIIDCGANHGDFSDWISKHHTDASIYAFEPDLRLFQKLPKLERTIFYPLAVTGAGKPLSLMLGEARCSTAYFSERVGQNSVEVESVKLEDFCNEKCISRVDLLKLDVEGAEIDILIELSAEFLSNIGQITVEFHDFIQKSEVPRIRKVIEKLINNGFFFFQISRQDYADVLFVNSNIYRLTKFDVLKIYLIKYYRGLCRKIHRLINSSQK